MGELNDQRPEKSRFIERTAWRVMVMRTLVVVSAILMVHCIAPWGLVLRSSATAAPQDSPAQQVSPAQAARVRSQIRAVEEILPRTPERGAALFLLAQRSEEHTSEPQSHS